MNKTRYEHFKELEYEYGVPMEVIISIASVLGPSEDYDGLISALEDWEYMN